ncbi:MAG: hypothetical protein Q7S31_03115 [bacterium]|nr:hypothetical protein [bacterium]
MEDTLYNEFGQIKDKKTAHEIANLERPARDRELELRRQAETNLTTAERENLAIMAKYQEKYPEAFEKKILDSSGRQVLVVDTGLSNGQAEGNGLDGVLYFTQEGFFRLTMSDYGNFALVGLPADEAVKLASRAKDEKADGQGNYGWLGVRFEFTGQNGNPWSVSAGASKLDVIGNEKTRQQIKGIMTARQKVGEEKGKQRQAAGEAKKIENVLADL